MSLDFYLQIWVHCLSSSIHRCLLTIEQCFTLIFNFTVRLVSMCCCILFEVFTQSILLGKRYFFNCLAWFVNFSILSVISFSSNSVRRFSSFGSSWRPNFTCLGVFHLLFRMHKAQSREPIRVKRIPVLSRFCFKMLASNPVIFWNRVS